MGPLLLMASGRSGALRKLLELRVWINLFQYPVREQREGSEMTWGAPNPVWRGDTGLWEDSSRSIVHRQMALEKSSKDFSGSASLGQQDSSRDGRHPASAREKERTDP